MCAHYAHYYAPTTNNAQNVLAKIESENTQIRDFIQRKELRVSSYFMVQAILWIFSCRQMILKIGGGVISHVQLTSILHRLLP